MIIFLLFKLLIGCAAGYWIYSDAKKRGIEKNTRYWWSGGAVVITIFATQFILFLLAGYYFYRGKFTPVTQREDGIIDVEARVIEEKIEH